MKKNNFGKRKCYVLVFPDTNKPPRIVFGWEAVLKARPDPEKGRMRFRGFHSYEAAEAYLRRLMKIP